jgi:Na+/H+ antiporter NhaA
MASLSYPEGFEGREDALMTTLLNDAKLGILCGTITSAMLGSLILNKTLPKQYHSS